MKFKSARANARLQAQWKAALGDPVSTVSGWGAKPVPSDLLAIASSFGITLRRHESAGWFHRFSLRPANSGEWLLPLQGQAALSGSKVNGSSEGTHGVHKVQLQFTANPLIPSPQLRLRGRNWEKTPDQQL
jgi:hypothetical protein